MGKIQERFDWDEWIEILEPKWLPKGNIVENKKLSEQFEERMKLKFEINVVIGRITLTS